MENASKALIIAGAILLSIAIIGIGMTVFKMASSSMGNVNMSEQEIEAQNSKFSSYQGVQAGSTVRALCDAIRTNNSQNEDDVSKQIVLTEAAAADPAEADTAGTDSAGITTIRNKINSARRYTVSFGYTSSGLIKNIGIVVK